jgi:hypothetical protein
MSLSKGSKADKQYPRKLSEIPDKEGKVRVIAMADYWTNMLVKPLHEHLNSILKTIPEDCTFDQNNFKNHIDFFKEGKTFYSIDLKAATDLMSVH